MIEILMILLANIIILIYDFLNLSKIMTIICLTSILFEYYLTGIFFILMYYALYVLIINLSTEPKGIINYYNLKGLFYPVNSLIEIVDSSRLYYATEIIVNENFIREKINYFNTLKNPNDSFNTLTKNYFDLLITKEQSIDIFIKNEEGKIIMWQIQKIYYNKKNNLIFFENKTNLPEKRNARIGTKGYVINM